MYPNSCSSMSQLDAAMTDVSAAFTSHVAPKQPRRLITPPRHFMKVHMSVLLETTHSHSLLSHPSQDRADISSAVRFFDCSHRTFTPSLETVTALIFRAVLAESVKSLFGVVGAGMYGIDVLTFDASTVSGIISCESSHVVPIRSSFALCGSTEGRQCHIRVLQSSAFLTSLAVNSRAWQQEVATGK